jgi:predicted translin family RNA/ssDNA-binding protein
LRRYLADGVIGPAGKDIDYDMHLGALCDLTGELQRRQVKAAIAGDADQVERLYAEIESIVGELLKMDLSGYLRNKFDQSKNSLRRAEEVRYDVSIRRK